MSGIVLSFNGRSRCAHCEQQRPDNERFYLTLKDKSAWEGCYDCLTAELGPPSDYRSAVLDGKALDIAALDALLYDLDRCRTRDGRSEIKARFVSEYGGGS